MVNYTYTDTEGTQIMLTWGIMPGAIKYLVSRKALNTDDESFKIIDCDNNPTNDIYFEDIGDIANGNFGLQDGIYVYRVQGLNDSEEIVGTDYTSQIAVSTMIKVGRNFLNYRGDRILTPDDIRYTAFYGIDMVANNGDEYEDSQILARVEQATAMWERELNIDIRKKVLKCQPEENLIKGVHYDEEVDWFPFIPQEWAAHGFLKLRRQPVISVEKVKLVDPLDTNPFEITGWTRLDKSRGILNLFPKNLTNSAGIGYIFHNILGVHGRAFSRYPEGFKVDFTVGYEPNDIPQELLRMIDLLASVFILDELGDGLLAGFSSASNSIDGISQSFSSTQSATSAYFGARIKSYLDQIKTFKQTNKFKYNFPMSYL